MTDQQKSITIENCSHSFRNYIEERTTLDVPLFEALTEEYGGGRRLYKITPPVLRPPRRWDEGDRSWQLMRHVATQLFFRWKHYRKYRQLSDVQVLKAQLILSQYNSIELR